MARHSRRIADSGIHHVMLRGVNRDAIFIEEDDYERFLLALGKARAASGCSVLAYCLMPNHVHLVVQVGSEPIGTVIKRVGVRYAGCFNRKYGRVGHLFQDRFLSLPVETDAYLIAVVRYVWHNPVEAGLALRAEDYRWGSRRLLGADDSLVAGELLQRLAPDVASAAPAGVELGPLDGAATPGRHSRHTDDEVAVLLCNACGAKDSRDFAVLDATSRRKAIAELRTRSVSYRQLEKVTGLSRSALQRIHAAGRPA